MSRLTFAFCAALLLAGGFSAPADAQGTAPLARAKAGLSADAGAALEQAVRDAERQGLPGDVLVTKALEGIAKGVPGDRIIVAVRQLSAELGRAQALLRAAGRPGGRAEVAAVEVALSRGVPADAVRRLSKEASREESVQFTIQTLADLVERDVPVAVALDVIGAWRKQGGKPQSLDEIPATVERLVRQGVLPAQAGAAVAAGIRSGKALGTLGAGDAGARGVLQSQGKAKGKGKKNE